MKEMTFYSSKTGVKVSLTKREKEKKGYLITTRIIALTFFKLEKTKPAKFILNPEEAYWLSVKLRNAVSKDVSKQRYDESVFIHKYEKNNITSTSTLILSKFINNGKVYYSIRLKKTDNDSNVDINVPLLERSVIFLSKLLENMSYEATETYYKKKEEEVTSDVGLDDLISDATIVDTVSDDVDSEFSDASFELDETDDFIKF